MNPAIRPRPPPFAISRFDLPILPMLDHQAKEPIPGLRSQPFQLLLLGGVFVFPELPGHLIYGIPLGHLPQRPVRPISPAGIATVAGDFLLDLPLPAPSDVS